MLAGTMDHFALDIKTSIIGFVIKAFLATMPITSSTSLVLWGQYAGISGEVAQWLRAIRPYRGPELVPSTHIGWLTTAYSSSPREPNALFWTSWALYDMYNPSPQYTHLHTLIQTHPYIIKNKIINLKKDKVKIKAMFKLGILPTSELVRSKLLEEAKDRSIIW